MSRLRKQVIGVLAAATVAAASFAAPPPASALPWSCATRHALWAVYMGAGDAWYWAGEYARASFWYGKAAGVLGGC